LSYIAVSNSGAVWGCNANDQIFMRTGISGAAPTGSGWQQIDGALKTVGVCSFSVWGTNANNDIYMRTGVSSLNPAGSGWQHVDGKLTQISVGPQGEVWGVNGSQDIFMRTNVSQANPAGSGWMQVDGKAVNVAVGQGVVYVVNAGGNIFGRAGTNAASAGGSWVQLDGSLKQVATCADGQPWGCNSGDDIWIRPGASAASPNAGGWAQVDGKLKVIGVGYIDQQIQMMMMPGKYRIKTAGHIKGGQPAGWGLAAWQLHGGQRNVSSSWVAVHSGDHWPCDWMVEPGKTPGSYRIKTCGHVEGGQPAGWGLSAWNAPAIGAHRNGSSSKVAVHEGDHWPCDWLIVPGSQPGTWRIKTCGHVEGGQPSGWGLSAWQLDTKRNQDSSWVCVHEGDEWPCDWIFEPRSGMMGQPMIGMQSANMGPVTIGLPQMLGVVPPPYSVVVPHPAPVVSTLGNGQTLGSGGELLSSNQLFKFCNQADGNLVVYQRQGLGWSPLWASNTHGKGRGPHRLVMQGDNHLVQYDSVNTATWASGVYNKGQAGAYAVMQDDGNFVVYDGAKQPMWCTRTEGGKQSPHSGTGHRLM